MTQTMYNTYSEMDFYIFNVQTQSQTQETKTKLKSKTVEKSCQQTHWAEPKKTEVVPAAPHPHNPPKKTPKQIKECVLSETDQHRIQIRLSSSENNVKLSKGLWLISWCVTVKDADKQIHQLVLFHTVWQKMRLCFVSVSKT